MKICFVGAGGIGGTLGGRLAARGHDVALVARGAHLEAIRAQGLRLVDHVDGTRATHRLPASDDPAAIARERGMQDLIVIGLKAHAIAPMLPRLAPLLAPHTAVLPAINGLPWWYFYRAGGALDGARVDALDPQGTMFTALDCARVVGCVVHVATEVRAPGEVHHTGGRRLVVGEPDGSRSPRLAAICAALGAAGFEAEATDDIRHAVWLKLIGNLSFNPVAALTGLLMDQLCSDDDALAAIRATMVEAMAVAAHYGYPIRIAPQERIDLARQLGAAKISMLQDLEQRRPLELDAIVGAVLELGARAGIAMPATQIVYRLTRARARALGIA